MPDVQPSVGMHFEVECDVVVVGAGAAGLIAAMRARESGATVLVLERDAIPRGSTALSAGLIPAAGTRFQRDAGVSDSLARFAADIRAKAEDQSDPVAVDTVVAAVGPALEWLAERHGLPLSVVTNFTYPGHSTTRMHGLPSRSGAELMNCLRAAADGAGVDVVLNATVTTLYADRDRRVVGVGLRRPDGSADDIGCKALVLASNGYGGNADLIGNFIHEMTGAIYFGHPGNQGEALLWGQALGAATRHLSGYQGHGSVAHPHGILITWATVTEGGFQVNRAGARFNDESHGYSEAAAAVIRQPEQMAWTIFDGRIAAIARQFEDFRTAEAVGAVLRADTIEALAEAAKLPTEALLATFRDVSAFKASDGTDTFGRDWRGSPQLGPPLHAVRVTGALFHTQGGLVVGPDARVMTPSSGQLPNLFAVGGAAAGVSGDTASGYLSGNGLLTAVAYGYLAGPAAARLAAASK